MAISHKRERTTAKHRGLAKMASFGLADGLARLVDIAPAEIVVFTEESDWAFLGGDFRAAFDAVIAEHPQFQQQESDEDEELVEA